MLVHGIDQARTQAPSVVKIRVESLGFRSFGYVSIPDNFPAPRAHKVVKRLQSAIALTANFPWSQATLLCGRLGQTPKRLRKSSPTLSIYVHRRESGDRLGRFETRSPQFPRSTEFCAIGTVFFSPSYPGGLSQSTPLSRGGVFGPAARGR